MIWVVVILLRLYEIRLPCPGKATFYLPGIAQAAASEAWFFFYPFFYFFLSVRNIGQSEHPDH